MGNSSKKAAASPSEEIQLNPKITKDEYLALLVESSATGVFPSMNSRGMCVYNDGAGHKCAFGILMDENHMSYETCIKKFNDWSCDDILKSFPGLIQDVEGFGFKNYTEVQRIHDGYACKVKHKIFDEWPHEEFVKTITEYFRSL